MKSNRRIDIFAYVFGIIRIAFASFWHLFYSIHAGKIISTYKGYINVPCLLYSSAIFIFFRYGGEKIMQNQIVCKIINKIKSILLAFICCTGTFYKYY
jgi:hypothetical protein